MEQLKHILIEKIETGSLRQKPRWQFVLSAVLSIVGIVFLFGAALYIISFIALITREQSFIRLLGFGPRGFAVFMHQAPWVLIFLLGCISIILYILIKRYAFVYSKPTIYRLIGIGCIICLISFAIFKIDTHMRFAKFGDAPRLPILGDAHDRFRHIPNHEITHGIVLSVAGDTLLVQTSDPKPELVHITPSTKIAPDTILLVGNAIVIFGPKHDEIIEAFGIISEQKDLEMTK
jgi:preprotein translocase subunit SecG